MTFKVDFLCVWNFSPIHCACAFTPLPTCFIPIRALHLAPSLSQPYNKIRARKDLQWNFANHRSFHMTVFTLVPSSALSSLLEKLTDRSPAQRSSVITSLGGCLHSATWHCHTIDKGGREVEMVLVNGRDAVWGAPIGTQCYAAHGNVFLKVPSHYAK